MEKKLLADLDSVLLKLAFDPIRYANQCWLPKNRAMESF